MSKFTDFSSYNKHQAILTSGRVILNAKHDSVFIIASRDLAVSVGGDVHFNVGVKKSKTSKFILNSPIIQFGLESKDNKKESVAKGDTVVNLMKDILDNLKSFLSDLSTAKGLVSGGVATLPTINSSAVKLGSEIKVIESKLENIKSKITFTT